jgi:hypothetical protein
VLQYDDWDLGEAEAAGSQKPGVPGTALESPSIRMGLFKPNWGDSDGV